MCCYSAGCLVCVLNLVLSVMLKCYGEFCGCFVLLPLGAVDG